MSTELNGGAYESDSVVPFALKNAVSNDADQLDKAGQSIPQRAIGCLDNGVCGEPNESSSKRRITGKVEDDPTTHSLVLRRAPYPDIDIVVRESGKRAPISTCRAITDFHLGEGNDAGCVAKIVQPLC